MTQRTEAEIRAEIERKKAAYEDYAQGGNEYACNSVGRYIAALEWVLSASPSPVAGDDEIVEAMAIAYMQTPFNRSVHNSMRSVLADARPLIERAARASADEEIAALRASLAKAEEALRRIAELTPMRANATTAHHLHLSIKAIAITALSAPDLVGEKP